MPIPILSGRFGVLAWAEQSNYDTIPTTGWKSFGIVRDVRVRAPAGANVLRSVGVLEAAGIAVVETAMDNAEITVNIEAVGADFKELCGKAFFNPSNHATFPNELTPISVVFGDVRRGRFVMVDSKISRIDINVPADRYVSATVTLVGRYITTHSGTWTAPTIPTQVFLAKEGTCDYGEILEARLRVNHRIEPRHTIKQTQPVSGKRRIPDYLVEYATEISGTITVYWTDALSSLKNDTLSTIDIDLAFVDFADSNKTMNISVSGARIIEVSKDFPAERDITAEIEWRAVNWSVT